MCYTLVLHIASFHRAGKTASYRSVSVHCLKPYRRNPAALAIAAHPDAMACPGLVECLNDEDNVVAVLAVNALESIGSPAIPALMEAYERATPRARIHLMRAMAQIRDPRAIALMMKAMGQDSAAAQYWAQQGLEMLGLNMVYLGPN